MLKTLRRRLTEKVRVAREVMGVVQEAAQAYKDGQVDYAIALYKRAILLAPMLPDSYNNLGVALMDKHKTGEAERCYRKCLELKPGHADAHNNLGIVLRVMGDVAGAVREYDEAIRIRPEYAEAYFNRVDCMGEGEHDTKTLAGLMNSRGMTDARRAYACFALAKAWEDQGNWESAWGFYEQGNRLRRAQVEYREEEVLGFVERVKGVFTPRMMRDLGNMQVGETSRVPVFIVGMPRSGSTLVEQILASHPAVYGGGEMDAIERAGLMLDDGEYDYPECVREFGVEVFGKIGANYLRCLPLLPDPLLRITDKLPSNFLMVGLIRLILPNARIIHTTRDPLDTCFSCYSKLFKSPFQNFSYDLGELGRFYKAYHGLMAHWRGLVPMLEVRYEDLVYNQEIQSKRIVEYCGLEWDPACLRYWETQRPIHTASAVQVRKPMFDTSVGRGARFGEWAGELVKELEGLA